ncbi:MAG: adenylyltransferase/cytidyltransferase family protein [Oscillospiraceae bacterium]|nr:adenylyltransferase/cytidyltransferase family protein [Oscillospiraceae bacterium]
MRVLVFGVFDYFHYGHFMLLKRAAGLGDYLIAAVQKDEEIHKTKPNARILYSFQQRLELISAIRYVDEAVGYTQVDETIPTLDFDILVLGSDQNHSGFQRAVEWCKANGKQVITLPRTPNISSSQLRGIVEKD